MAEHQDNQLPPAIPAELANKILLLMDLKTLYDAWGRHKDLLRRCPHHGLPLWLQVQMFYNGVNPSTRQMIDATTGGTINNKTPEKAYEFIKEMSLNNYQWQVMRTKPTKIAGVYNVDSVTMLSNQVELLNKKIDGLLGSTQVHPVIQCEASGGRLSNPEYQPYGHNMENEQLNYLGNNLRSQNNPYSNTYNAGWRNHPKFSWGSQGNQRPPPPSGFQQPPYQQEEKPNLEEMLSKFILVSETHFQNTETALKNQQEQLNTINVQDEEGSVELEPEPMDLLVNKRKLDEASHVELNTVCSAILQNKLPQKLKDPGSFTIPCLIGSLDVNNALADLGASINVMPYKMFKQLDIEEDNNTPLILGRPFLATAKTIIDVGTGELTLRVGDETITLQARNSGNTSKIEGNCPHQSTKTDNMTQPTLQELSLKEVHESYSSNNRRPIHEERRLQIKELDEWRAHKPRTHDKPKLHQNKLDTSPNQLKVRDKVLLDTAVPHIVTANLNEEIPLTVLSIFPFGMRSMNSSNNHDHSMERFTTETRPSTRACLGPLETGQRLPQNTGCDKSPRPCDMAVAEPTKTTLACDTPVP
ncbi:hypothetical protein CXB51_014485 [Gossypium anomalum]|uniref:Retrotransposon gag domain-containing protein n=1 Tax=Gossypium anomalum TaxID=47600 RepID=A0A8J6CXR9_9ROSI|nr:hypothetical protein CXB51_014485 [Gossypium anomalum]